MATVTVNVQANTSDATNDVNQLDNALEGADRAAEDLNQSLEKQEARIKTLGGAINILGGSVELLAAGLSVSGALTEEQAENFTKVAAEALLFADGSKRVFEGVKELNEGLSGLGGITGVVTKAFNRLKIAALANPYTALAIALGAVTAAVIAFTRETKDEITEAEKLNEKLDRQIALYKGVGTAALGADVKLAQLQASAEARNITLEEAIKLERDRAKVVRDEANEEVIRLESLRGSQRLNQETLEKQIEAERLRRDNAKGALDLLIATEVAYKNVQEEAAKAVGGSPEKAVEFYLKPKLVVPEAEEQVDTIGEWFEAQTGDTGAQLKPIELPVRVEADLGETTILEQAEVLGGKIGEALSSPVAEGIQSNLDAASTLTSALVNVVDDGSKEAFEKSKKYKIADVVTSSTKAAFDAFAAAQAYGPILGPILGAAQVAAIAVSANRAIQDIRSSTFDSSSVSGGGAGAVSAPAGFSPGGLGGSQQTLVTNVPPPEAQPMRAYVLTGDVTSGIEAEAQLSSRRTFGPG
jgi:hypothetical protein